MHTEIKVLRTPIERIQRTCDLIGLLADFERKLPALETYLEPGSRWRDRRGSLSRERLKVYETGQLAGQRGGCHGIVPEDDG
jgi:hypothetical protein